jgi:hypothetical protein
MKYHNYKRDAGRGLRLETELIVLLPEPMERVLEREKRQRRALRNKLVAR